MKQIVAGMLVLLALLGMSGCAPLLERTYVTAEPHSSKFWESEAASTLRAENYQDVVNDLLLLIGQHTETATLRLYNFQDDMTVAETLEQATTEIQQETPMGAYAVEYITSTSQAQRGYYEIAVRISYRRTAEQIQNVVNATSTEALYTLCLLYTSFPAGNGGKAGPAAAALELPDGLWYNNTRSITAVFAVSEALWQQESNLTAMRAFPH